MNTRIAGSPTFPHVPSDWKGITPGTFTFHGAASVYDDGNGNLIDEATGKKIGTINYATGDLEVSPPND